MSWIKRHELVCGKRRQLEARLNPQINSSKEKWAGPQMSFCPSFLSIQGYYESEIASKEKGIINLLSLEATETAYSRPKSTKEIGGTVEQSREL